MRVMAMYHHGIDKISFILWHHQLPRRGAARRKYEFRGVGRRSPKRRSWQRRGVRRCRTQRSNKKSQCTRPPAAWCRVLLVCRLAPVSCETLCARHPGSGRLVFLSLVADRCELSLCVVCVRVCVVCENPYGLRIVCELRPRTRVRVLLRPPSRANSAASCRIRPVRPSSLYGHRARRSRSLVCDGPEADRNASSSTRTTAAPSSRRNTHTRARHTRTRTQF